MTARSANSAAEQLAWIGPRLISPSLRNSGGVDGDVAGVGPASSPAGCGSWDMSTASGALRGASRLNCGPSLYRGDASGTPRSAANWFCLDCAHPIPEQYDISRINCNCDVND